MISPSSTARAPLRLCLALGAIAAMVLSAPPAVEAQVVQGVQQGAKAGNKAAGPVGGVLGGAIGGVVGVFTGVLGGPANNSQAPATAAPPGAKQAGRGKSAKAAKGKAAQTAEPQLTAEQIVANSDAYIDRIKAELKLTPEQEKNWNGFNRALHYLGQKGA